MTNVRRIFLALILVAAATFSIGATSSRANAATAEDLDKNAAQALQLLYKTNPIAAEISKKAKAVLVFPNIVKAGLIFGGAYGEGVLNRIGEGIDIQGARIIQRTSHVVVSNDHTVISSKIQNG